MVKIKPQQQITENWIEGSIRKGYLTETKSIEWIIGIIKDASLNPSQLQAIINTFRNLNFDKNKVDVLEERCKKEALL